MSAKLNDTQSKDAYDLINEIIKELIPRTSELAFRYAWKQVFHTEPDPRLRLDQPAAYKKLFKIDRHYLQGNPNRRLRKFPYIKSTHSALQHLGYTFPSPNQNDPSAWIEFLKSALNEIRTNLPSPPSPDGADAKNETPETKPVIDLLNRYAIAAIVGDPDGTNKVAKAAAAHLSKSGWNIIECDATESLAPARSVNLPPGPESYVVVWTQIILALMKNPKKRDDDVWVKFNAEIDKFLRIWASTERLSRDPLQKPEHAFLSELVTAKRISRDFWRELSKLMREYGSHLQNPMLIAALLNIVRDASDKPLIVIYNVEGFLAATESAGIRFERFDETAKPGNFRLLVTSRQPTVLASWESDDRKFTYQLASSGTHMLSPKVLPVGNSRDPILIDPRVIGRIQSYDPSFAESLWANVEGDDFVGREDDLAFLRGFLGAGADDKAARFRWAIITGAGGEGKTRLVIQFFYSLDAMALKAGFLTFENLQAFDAASWRPSQPTFIIIDYVAQVSKLVVPMMRLMSNASSDGQYSFPVRVLLLERDTSGEWFKNLVSPDGVGNAVRRKCYRDSADKLDYRMKPLSRVALLEIMRGRLGDCSLRDDPLFEALCRIDPSKYDFGKGLVPAPRPIFAAAVAQAIVELSRAHEDIDKILEVLRRADVLRVLIDRNRVHFWANFPPPLTQTEKQQLRIHENLLLAATVALDLPRATLQGFDNKNRDYLPDEAVLDEDRYQRMSGCRPLSNFCRLEPDLIGEFFALDRLAGLNEPERQYLIDTSLAAGGDRAALFLIYTAIDFPEEWRSAAVRYFEPSGHSPGRVAFLKAAANLMRLLPAGRSADAAALVGRCRGIADQNRFQDVDEIFAVILLDYGEFLERMARHGLALEVREELSSRYGTFTEPRIGEVVAAGQLAKSISLKKLGRLDDALIAFENIANRYRGVASESEVIRDVFERALFDRGAILANCGRPDEAIALFDEIIANRNDRDGAEDRLRVLRALGAKAALLATALHRTEEARAIYNDLFQEFRAEVSQEIRTVLAQVLRTKAQILTELKDDRCALSTCCDIIDILEGGADLKQQQLWALACKGAAARHAEFGEKGDMIIACDLVINRFRDSGEQELRRFAAHLMSTKALHLARLKDFPAAIRAADETMSYCGRSTDAVLSRAVRSTLLVKGNALLRLQRLEEALAVFVKLLEDCECDRDCRPVWLAWARSGKARALLALERPDQALSLYERIREMSDEVAILSRDPRLTPSAPLEIQFEDGEPEEEFLKEQSYPQDENVHEVIAAAYPNIGMLHHQWLSDHRAAVDTIDELEALYGRIKSGPFPETVCAGLIYKATALGALAEIDAAVTLIDDFVKRYTATDFSLKTNALALSALMVKACLLNIAGRFDEAEKTYPEALHRTDKLGTGHPVDPADNPRLKTSVLMSVKMCDLIIAQGAANGDIGRHRLMVGAYFAKMIALSGLRFYHEMLLTSDELSSAYGETNDVQSQRFVANALMVKSEALLKMRDLDSIRMIVAVYDEIIAKFSNVMDSEIQATVNAAIAKRKSIQELLRSSGYI